MKKLLMVGLVMMASSSALAVQWTKVPAQDWALNDPKYFYVQKVSTGFPIIVGAYENVDGDMWHDFMWTSQLIKLNPSEIRVHCSTYAFSIDNGLWSITKDSYTRVDTPESAGAFFSLIYDSIKKPKDLFNYAANVDATCATTKPNMGDYKSGLLGPPKPLEDFKFNAVIGGKLFELVEGPSFFYLRGR